MRPGIYKIVNIKNDHFYVGSASDLKKRWSHHLHFLRRNKHENAHLQNAWNKYGESAFQFKVEQQCPIHSLLKNEQRWLNEHCGQKHCYNIAKNAKHSGAGRTLSSTHKKKISVALAGRTLSEEHKKKIGKSNKGRVINRVGRKNMSNARKGITLSVDHKQKISNSMKGEHAPLSKLTENDVRSIREEYGAKSYSTLATQFSVDKKTIINVVKHRTWNHI